MREHAQLKALLPHGHPILLVDRIVAVEPGARIQTTKAISASEPCYADLAEGVAHSAYAYPSALLVESFVQSAALLWAESASAEPAPRHTLLLMGVRDVRFHQAPYPGDVITHEVELTQSLGSNAFFSGNCTLLGTGEQILTVKSVVLGKRPAASLSRA